MIFIYKIQNQINKKIYIGSTKNPDKRWFQHKQSSQLKSRQSYNYPLQAAIRKYGIENFTFEIIDECEDDKASLIEQKYIIELNSMINTGHGYNQTLYTDCALRDPNITQQMREKTGKKCAWVDGNNTIIKIYSSLHEAAQDMNVNISNNCASMITRVCNGEAYSINNRIFRFLDEYNNPILPIQKTRKRRACVCGISINDIDDIVYYESISEAARKEGINRSSITKCLAGSTKYSNVKKRIWRKVENNNIIENKIPIQEILDKFKEKR